MRCLHSILLIVSLVSLGVPAYAQWQLDGVPVSEAAGAQLRPTLAFDGAGGAILTWIDQRTGGGPTGGDIYAQRFNAAGGPQWTLDGVAVCTTPNAESFPTPIVDGAGGAIVAWEGFRSGSSYNIYAQRVDASGVPQWTADGIEVCAAVGSQVRAAIVSDGTGGAIIAWRDFRPGSLNSDIYAQRVSASGVVQWTAGGVALCIAPSNQFDPTVVADGAGGAIVTWYDQRTLADYDVYAQRVNALGAPQWTADGVAVCTASSNQTHPFIASDDAEGAIITWDDFRSGSVLEVYAQRVGASGTFEWTDQGVLLGGGVDPRIVSDGEGGAIVAWHNYGDIFAQRLDDAGGSSGLPMESRCALRRTSRYFQRSHRSAREGRSSPGLTGGTEWTSISMRNM